MTIGERRKRAPDGEVGVPSRDSRREARATKLGRKGRMCCPFTLSARLIAPRPSYRVIASTCVVIYKQFLEND